jgi:signal peptidase II
MKSFRGPALVLLVETLAVAAADQLTKTLVRLFLNDHQPVTVIPGVFNLVHWKNTGIAFGLFQNRGDLLAILGVLALVIIPILFWWEWRRDPRLANVCWGLGLVLGGALGNLIDRLARGHVTDFLDFYIGTHHWPAFNLADSCICIGTGLVLYFAYKSPSPGENPGTEEQSEADPVAKSEPGID